MYRGRISSRQLGKWILYYIQNRLNKECKGKKVKVLRELARLPDGTVVKKTTDGWLTISTVFKPSALVDAFESYEGEEPNWADALLILRKFTVQFLCTPKQPHGEYLVLVDEFTVWDLQPGFGLKYDVINCMWLPEVRALAGNERMNMIEESQTRRGELDHLLELITQHSQDVEEEIQEESEEKKNTVPDVMMEKLCQPFSTEEFDIPDTQWKVLESLTEWQTDFIPSLPAEQVVVEEQYRASGDELDDYLSRITKKTRPETSQESPQPGTSRQSPLHIEPGTQTQSQEETSGWEDHVDSVRFSDESTSENLLDFDHTAQRKVDSRYDTSTDNEENLDFGDPLANSTQLPESRLRSSKRRSLVCEGDNVDKTNSIENLQNSVNKTINLMERQSKLRKQVDSFRRLKNLYNLDSPIDLTEDSRSPAVSQATGVSTDGQSRVASLRDSFGHKSFSSNDSIIGPSPEAVGHGNSQGRTWMAQQSITIKSEPLGTSYNDSMTQQSIAIKSEPMDTSYNDSMECSMGSFTAVKIEPEETRENSQSEQESCSESNLPKTKMSWRSNLDDVVTRLKHNLSARKQASKIKYIGLSLTTQSQPSDENTNDQNRVERNENKINSENKSGTNHVSDTEEAIIQSGTQPFEVHRDIHAEESQQETANVDESVDVNTGCEENMHPPGTQAFSPDFNNTLRQQSMSSEEWSILKVTPASNSGRDSQTDKAGPTQGFSPKFTDTVLNFSDSAEDDFMPTGSNIDESLPVGGILGDNSVPTGGRLRDDSLPKASSSGDDPKSSLNILGDDPTPTGCRLGDNSIPTATGSRIVDDHMPIKKSTEIDSVITGDRLGDSGSPEGLPESPNLSPVGVVNKTGGTSPPDCYQEEEESPSLLTGCTTQHHRKQPIKEPSEQHVQEPAQAGITNDKRGTHGKEIILESVNLNCMTVSSSKKHPPAVISVKPLASLKRLHEQCAGLKESEQIQKKRKISVDNTVDDSEKGTQSAGSSCEIISPVDKTVTNEAGMTRLKVRSDTDKDSLEQVEESESSDIVLTSQQKTTKVYEPKKITIDCNRLGNKVLWKNFIESPYKQHVSEPKQSRPRGKGSQSQEEKEKRCGTTIDVAAGHSLVYRHGDTGGRKCVWVDLTQPCRSTPGQDDWITKKTVTSWKSKAHCHEVEGLQTSTVSSSSCSSDCKITKVSQATHSGESQSSSQETSTQDTKNTLTSLTEDAETAVGRRLQTFKLNLSERLETQLQSLWKKAM